MSQIKEFALRSLRCSNFRALCQQYGISAKTGYKWKKRLIEEGYGQLAEKSRRPLGHAHGLRESVVCEMVRLKQAHRHWGPRKIRRLYERQYSNEVLPSESSFKRVLERAGLTNPRKRTRAKDTGRLCSGRKAQSPNEIWTVDFKGWWRSQEGDRVEPLSIRDEFSRNVLELRVTKDGRNETVRLCFERVFEQNGLPGAIRSDNGPPFASTQGLLGLTRLSAWWLALGIDLERSRPGCPQDNGAHERMHLDISIELQSGRIGRDQHAFDLWRHQYNHERPHEALAMACPAEIYIKSERTFQGSPDQLDYQGMQTRLVRPKNGTVSFKGQSIFVSTALGGWQIGLEPKADGSVDCWFANLLIGYIDPQTLSFHAARPGSMKATKPNQNK